MTELVGKVSGLSYHYRAEGPSSTELPAAGDRMPNVELPASAGAQWLSELLRHTNFTLLAAVRGGATPQTLEDGFAAIANRYRGRVAVRVVQHAPQPLIGAEGAARAYLVRPDGYVAESASGTDCAPIERWLAAFLS